MGNLNVFARARRDPQRIRWPGKRRNERSNLREAAQVCLPFLHKLFNLPVMGFDFIVMRGHGGGKALHASMQRQDRICELGDRLGVFSDSRGVMRDSHAILRNDFSQFFGSQVFSSTRWHRGYLDCNRGVSYALDT